MSNVLAGIGRGQMRVLEERVNARRRIFRRYREGLSDIAGVGWMPEINGGRSTHWLSVCTLDPKEVGITARDLIATMSERNIETRHVWKPLHRQPLFRGVLYFQHSDVSTADDLFGRGVCLPSGSNLTVDQQDQIIRALRDLLGG